MRFLKLDYTENGVINIQRIKFDSIENYSTSRWKDSITLHIKLRSVEDYDRAFSVSLEMDELTEILEQLDNYDRFGTEKIVVDLKPETKEDETYRKELYKKIFHASMF